MKNFCHLGRSKNTNDKPWQILFLELHVLKEETQPKAWDCHRGGGVFFQLRTPISKAVHQGSFHFKAVYTKEQ